MIKQSELEQYQSQVDTFLCYQHILGSKFNSLTNRQVCEVEHQSGSERRLIKRWITGQTAPSMIKFINVLQSIEKVLEKELDDYKL